MAKFDILGGDKKVETDFLIIEDNVMRWANTIIQISNIAIITTVNTKTRPFPFLSLLPLLGGIIAVNSGELYGWVFIIAAVLWIIYWLGQNQSDKEKEVLSISLNSGLTYNILFHDKKFLREVMKQLVALVSKPYTQRSLVINVKDSTFGGNASVVGTMNS